MHRLLQLGFIPVGHWFQNGDQIQFNLDSNHASSNILYSFISNGEIKYIGKTTMQLMRRMYGYRNPGPTQSTNIRVNEEIRVLLQDENSVDIFILVDNGLLSYGGYRISLAAGLEDTLIREISPQWNFRGNTRVHEDANSERIQLTDIPPENQLNNNPMIEVILGTTYFNQSFFNIREEHKNLFADDNTVIDIYLGQGNENVIQGYINRRATGNDTPRIMGGVQMRNWIQDNFNLHNILTVEVITPNSIRLLNNN